ncbi:MAG: hypothetical protein E6J90_41970 [Deltaproteobacteria bacterium]|nr:MAG: hypothetical protein E6J90_41970 [Deltaproteobacteria bacterium]TMQ08116.1 MAG: hypothetical protein E6J91_34020 [Deltaproteobacteria bacterium]
MTLEELRRQRARDMIRVIDDQQPPAQSDASDYGAASARELEWLQPFYTLVDAGVTRSATAPHQTFGVVSPFSPSMLVVIYTARYVLSSDAPPGTRRAVYTAYGAMQATLLPTARHGLL